jgi:hypothetical protein
MSDAKPKIPPTTPPAIAPVLVDRDPLLPVPEGCEGESDAEPVELLVVGLAR